MLSSTPFRLFLGPGGTEMHLSTWSINLRTFICSPAPILAMLESIKFLLTALFLFSYYTSWLKLSPECGS